MIKKIIMDLDNTLFDTKTSAVLAYDKFLKKYNYEIDSLMLYKTLGKFDYSKESLFDYLKKILNDFNIEKYNDFKKMYIEEVGLIDSKTKETLAYLKEKYELIVFSNWVYDLQYAILEKEDLIKYFKHIFTSDK
ncbi:MAG: HAD hydrolase-like protein [Mycoplasmatota bacterium]